MRFSFVDRITSLEPGQSVTAVKALSRAEEYLADHFPGFPVMPGVLMLEALIQAGAWLMRYTEDFQYSVIMLKQARSLRFNNFVAPGQTLAVTATVHERSEREWVFKGNGAIDGVSAFSARIALEQFNLRENNPDFIKSDQVRIEEFRRIFAEVWTPQADGQAPRG